MRISFQMNISNTHSTLQVKADLHSQHFWLSNSFFQTRRRKNKFESQKCCKCRSALICSSWKIVFTSISLFCKDNAFHYFSFVANVSDALIFLDVAMHIQIVVQLYRMGTHEWILSYPMVLFYWSFWLLHFSSHYCVSKFVVSDPLFSFKF